MSNRGRYHGGLVFPEKRSHTLDDFCRIVSASLEDYGHKVERTSRLTGEQARITTGQYVALLSLVNIPAPSDTIQRSERVDEAGEINLRRRDTVARPSNRLTVTLCATDRERDDSEQSEALLAVMLYRSVEATKPEFVEWLWDDAVLTADLFLQAFAKVSPRRVRSRQACLQDMATRFDPVEETARRIHHQIVTNGVPDAEAEMFDPWNALARPGELVIQSAEAGNASASSASLSEEDAIALVFRSEPGDDEQPVPFRLHYQQGDIWRLGSWVLTGAVAVLSGPVGLSLAAVNLIKGEDFRLNTQVCSLTGMLVVLQSSGALAGAVSKLPL